MHECTHNLVFPRHPPIVIVANPAAADSGGAVRRRVPPAVHQHLGEIDYADVPV